MTAALPPLRFSYPQRLLILLIISFAGFFFCGILLVAFMLISPSAVVLTRISTVIQDLTIFIFPAIATAIYITPLPARLLCIDSLPSIGITLAAVGAMTASIPLMNAIVAWNASLTLPSWAAGVEAWMRSSEAAAQNNIDLLLSGDGIVASLCSILIVGALAGLSEELMFRGALQRILGSGVLSPHATIWLTAVIFSAFHMQFFGFVPRLLLGAFFGYLLYWSGSLWLPVLLHIFNNSIYVVSARHTSDIVNTIGTDSPLLIITSLLLTSALLILIVRHRQSDKSQS